MANEVIKNDASITLDWSDVSGANVYHLQVSEYPDFSGVMVEEDTALAGSTHSFTDGGSANSKRWWRWRSSDDGGSTWSAWSEVGSYWINTGFSADLSLSTEQWIFVNPSDLTDRYVLADFPLYSIQRILLDRAKVRNRKGGLLSEFITIKDVIALRFPDTVFMGHEQMREIVRFHTQIKTFFLATLKTNGSHDVPNIWKAQFQSDPALTMLAAGRQDLFVGELILEEV